MKLKKTKKDIIESIKSVSSKKKNEMFEVDSKVQAVASPSFVDALEMSAKNKQMVIDRMKEKEKERKEFMKQTVERTANKTPKSDDMKKMKMVEEFINESFKDKLTINENIFTVTTKLRTELRKLIENARKHEVKYTIERINEEYRFNYKFESLNKKLNEERKYVAGFFSKGKKDSYTEMSDEKWKSLDSDVKVKDLLDMWWNSVRIKGKGIKGEALLYKDCHDGSYELDEEHNSHGEDILNMTVHTHYEYDEDGDGYPIIYAKLLSKEVKESSDKINVEKCKDILNNQIDWTEVDVTGDVGFAVDQLRSLHSEGEISADEYDYITVNWDNLLESVSKDSPLKEEKALTTSKYKDIIASHFDYSVDFEFLDIIALILDRIDFEEDLDDEIDVAINDSLVYIKDQWTVAEFYVSSPADLDWDEVLNDLSNDIHTIAKEIIETKENKE